MSRNPANRSLRGTREAMQPTGETAESRPQKRPLDTEDGEWRIADNGVGEVAQAAVPTGFATSSDHKYVGVVEASRIEQRLFHVADNDLHRRV
jgi:hypothetical protein